MAVIFPLLRQWPGLELACDCGAWRDAALTWINPADHGEVFGRNAMRICRL